MWAWAQAWRSGWRGYGGGGQVRSWSGGSEHASWVVVGAFAYALGCRGGGARRGAMCGITTLVAWVPPRDSISLGVLRTPYEAVVHLKFHTSLGVIMPSLVPCVCTFDMPSLTNNRSLLPNVFTSYAYLHTRCASQPPPFRLFVPHTHTHTHLSPRQSFGTYRTNLARPTKRSPSWCSASCS